MTASFWYMTNWNGPVPTGTWSNCSFLPALARKSAYSAETMLAKSIARLASIVVSGAVSCMRTV